MANQQNQQQGSQQQASAPAARPILFYRDYDREAGTWETYTPISAAKRADGSVDLVILRYGTQREVFPAVRQYSEARDKRNRAGTWAWADGED